MVFISCAVCLLIGFVAGFLVYRKNAKKAEAALAKAQEEIESLKAHLEKFGIY